MEINDDADLRSWIVAEQELDEICRLHPDTNAEFNSRRTKRIKAAKNLFCCLEQIDPCPSLYPHDDTCKGTGRIDLAAAKSIVKESYADSPAPYKRGHGNNFPDNSTYLEDGKEIKVNINTCEQKSWHRHAGGDCNMFIYDWRKPEKTQTDVELIIIICLLPFGLFGFIYGFFTDPAGAAGLLILGALAFMVWGFFSALW
jgi:hypothetical protein